MMMGPGPKALFLSKHVPVTAMVLLGTLLIAPAAFAQQTEQIKFKFSKISALGNKWLFPVEEEPVQTVTVNHNQSYNRLNELERQVYSREYPEQDDSQRITRLEYSLFGNRQLGNLDNRYQRVVGRLNEKSAQASQNNQARMLDYMEQKLFEQSYSDQTVNVRLNRLESHVFGRSFDTYPQEIRFKKLSYALPVMSRGVKVASRTSGLIVADTQRPVQTLDATPVVYSAAAIAPVQELSAIKETPDASLGDYSLNVFRFGADQALRWQKLPVLVHIHRMDSPQAAIVKQAVEQWQQTFPLQITATAAEADVIIDGRAALGGPMTRPVLQLDSHQHIRTTVVVQVAPLLLLTPSQSVRAVSHQVGHALGIWGHSDDPDDVMYPLTTFEANDIPQTWLRRSPIPSRLAPTYPLLSDTALLTQRDRNTLMRLYNIPAHDLKTFVPNMSR